MSPGGEVNPLTPKFKKYILLNLPEKCISDVVRIGNIITFHLRRSSYFDGLDGLGHAK